MVLVTLFCDGCESKEIFQLYNDEGGYGAYSLRRELDFQFVADNEFSDGLFLYCRDCKYHFSLDTMFGELVELARGDLNLGGVRWH